MKLITLFALFSFFSVVAQNTELHSGLTSRDSMPEFLKSYQSSYFLPQEKPYLKGTGFAKKEHLLDQIYSSNMIVYGDPISSYCKELLSKAGQNAGNVYVVRSNRKTTFSNSENDLFITTGIISQIASESELLFFLLREKEVMKQKLLPQLVGQNWNKNELSFDKLIDLITNFTNEDEMKLEQATLSLIQSFVSEDPKQILNTYYSIRLHTDAPFYEKRIDWSYFNDENVYIPMTEFLKAQRNELHYFEPEKEFPELAERKKKLLGEEFKVDNQNKTATFLVNKESFTKIVNLARRESIVLNLMSGNFYFALYEIYILESVEQNDPFMDKMKAFAWYGIVQQKVGKIELRNYISYFLSDNEGALFCRFVRSQNIETLMALAIRTIFDIKKENPSLASLTSLFEETVDAAAHHPRFDIAKFEKTNYKTHLSKYNVEVDSLNITHPNLIDKSKQHDLSKKVDSLKFQNYFLSDLVVNSAFIALYNSKKEEQPVPKATPSKIQIYAMDYRLFRHRRIKEEKFNPEVKTAIVGKAADQLKISLTYTPEEIYNTSSYNFKYALNSSIIQDYYYNHYKGSIQPVLAEVISREQNNFQAEMIAISVYYHEYRPKLIPLYFIAIGILPIPYVVPHFIYNGNRSLCAGFYFNTKSGQLEKAAIHRFHDPYNKQGLKNYLLESISKN